MDMIRQRKAELEARGKKGFTLMEMLIVIAIIAILIAIAIPIFNNQLDKARLATDQANARDLKSLAVTAYLSDGQCGTYGLDAAAGTLVSTGGGYVYQSNSWKGCTSASITVAADGALSGNAVDVIAAAAQ